ncbi:hypothetical protein GY45DRAFT_1308101 [Cubamyces sp. BRFM 1775]|nr:hypothetical protein GY45DRAFT_1308101 [Cubamyces sp. BRFM 1775]
MLSFVNSFRAAARRQPRTLPAARAISSAYAQVDTLDADPMMEAENMEQFSDFVLDVGEEQETLAAGSSVVESFDKAGAEVRGASINVKGSPVLKGFVPDEFVQPRDFTREVYLSRQLGRKKPLLGPDASTSRYLDVFHQSDIDPLNECQNSMLMSRFVTSMGKIKGRNETNLTWKNQRRLGKAIRRAKMMGIIPVLSRRPLLHNINKW